MHNKYWAEISYKFGKYDSKSVLKAESEDKLNELLKFKTMQHGRIQVTKYEGQMKVFEGEMFLKGQE